MRVSLNSNAPGRIERIRRLPSRVAAAATVVLLVAACQAGAGSAHTAVPAPGSAGAASALPSASASSPSEPSASPSATPTDTSPSAATAIDPRADGFDVTFGEFAITLEAPVIRPGRVTFVVHNAGQITHGFEMKIDGSGSGGDRKKIETRTFRSGESLRVEADLPAGVYEIECYVDGHASMGMHTSLEVRADAPLVTAAPGAAAPGTIRIVQFAFVAASLDVPAGTRITWTNDDPTPHTVTADGGTFDSKQLDPGATFAVLFDKPGTFTYHCDIHPTMVGTVVVH